ncbi:MAG: hypothetical protein JJU15_17965 [Pararhodobacter sp.]|nr:hypothetical protein [Pararhodobacter sp.]
MIDGLIEGIPPGVAFLAVGLIIMAGGRVVGITTGEGIWLAWASGLALPTLIVLPVL